VLFGERFGRRRGERLAPVLAVLACVLVAAPLAKGEEFTVTGTGDQADTAPGDKSCATASEGCTLRAAIQEVDASGKSGKIQFDVGVFNGQSAATIALGSSLPPLTVQTFINGRTCSTEAGPSGPCVGIEAHAGEPAITVQGGSKVEIWGLAITDAQTAVSVSESPSFKAQASWFGIGLDGLDGANGTGIAIGPGSDKSQIGSEGAERRNVIAASGGDGLEIHGASEVKVLGNYFGVGPDGVTPAANGGDDIEVVALGGEEAAATTIGIGVGSAGAATAACDAGCNVISDAGENGIDLQGDGGEEGPAVATAIAGNFLGPDATGAAVLPNAAADVRVGKATETAIGGHQLGEGNRINGGEVAVSAGTAAADLVVQGNWIGADAGGAVTLAPPAEGLVIDSGSLASAALEARILDNLIRMQGGPGILQRGAGATIAGNEVIGAETGIRTLGSTGKRGNLIEGNAVGAATGAGILLENNLNQVVGNAIGDAGTGIEIVGSGPFGVKENVVGGDAAADENTIDGSAGDRGQAFHQAGGLCGAVGLLPEHGLPPEVGSERPGGFARAFEKAKRASETGELVIGAHVLALAITGVLRLGPGGRGHGILGGGGGGSGSGGSGGQSRAFEQAAAIDLTCAFLVGAHGQSSDRAGEAAQAAAPAMLTNGRKGRAPPDRQLPACGVAS